MNNCIESGLLNEICTIKTPENYLIGRITDITSDTFSVRTISPSQEILDLNKLIEIKIETIENEVYFISTSCESIKETNEDITLILKPISQTHDKNKRKFNRLEIKLHNDEPIIIQLQQFPPDETTFWKKGDLVDISAGGIRVKENNFLSTGQLLELKLGLPFFNKNEYIVSRVVNKTKENDIFIFSIQFINISDENKQHLEQYIDNIINQYTNTGK